MSTGARRASGRRAPIEEGKLILPPKLAVLYGQMEEVRAETFSVLSGMTEEGFSRKRWNKLQTPCKQLPLEG
jgi:hypothetical protein